MDTVDEILAHYGVKGMRWGVRTKSGSDSSTAAPKKPKTYSSDADKASALGKQAKKQGAQSLSNDEMSLLIRRMQLDSQYSQLSAKQKSKGAQKALQILDQVGTQLASEALKGGVKFGVKTGFEAAMKKKK